MRRARTAPPARTMASTSATFSRAYRDRRGASVPALAGVSLHADHGELLAVVGPSGCGKTTLLELICGLQAPDRGLVECAPAALMPQRDLLLPWLSAVDNAALALRIAGRPRAAGPRAGPRSCSPSSGCSGFERPHPHELSGGMRQRVAFLRTLALGQARPLPGRAVRRARRDHARGDAGVARPRAGARAAHGRARHARRRGGDRARRSRRGALPPARPGARGDRGRPPPPPLAHRPAVVALREQALVALGMGDS